MCFVLFSSHRTSLAFFLLKMALYLCQNHLLLLMSQVWRPRSLKPNLHDFQCTSSWESGGIHCGVHPLQHHPTQPLELTLTHLLNLSLPKLWPPVCCFPRQNVCSCRSVGNRIRLSTPFRHNVGKHTVPDPAEQNHSNGNGGRSQKVGNFGWWMKYRPLQTLFKEKNQAKFKTFTPAMLARKELKG